MNHRGMLSQNQNLHRRTSHATLYVQSWNPQVHPTCRGAQDAVLLSARTASSDQTSSNTFDPSMFHGCADRSILAAPELGYSNIHEASPYAYVFHTDMEHCQTDGHNQAYQSRTEPWQMQPQEDNDSFEMDSVHPVTGESRENHWPWPTKAPQGDF